MLTLWSGHFAAGYQAAVWKIRQDVLGQKALYLAEREGNLVSAVASMGDGIDDNQWKIVTEQATLTYSRDVVVLVPDAAKILSQKVRLPRQARTDIDAPIRFGFAMWTPFQVADVHWMARIVGESKAAVDVEIRYILRSEISRIRSVVPFSGPIDFVALGASEEWLHDVEAGKPNRLNRRRRIDRFLCCFGVVMLIAAASTWSWRQEKAIALLQRQRAIEIESRRQESERLRSIEDLQARADVIETRTAKSVMVSEILTTIAGSMADDAYITEIKVSAGAGQVKIVSKNNFDLRLGPRDVIQNASVQSIANTSPVERTYTVAFKVVRSF